MSQNNDSNEGPPQIGVWVWTMALMAAVLGFLILSDMSGMILTLLRLR